MRRLPGRMELLPASAAAFAVALALLAPGCGGPKAAETAAQPPAPRAQQPAPSTQGQVVVSTAKAPADEPIRPSTRRSSAGLPDAILGYLSWTQLPLEPAAAAGEGMPHPAKRAAYASALEGATTSAELPVGTIVVLEGKPPETEFIGAVSVMTREPAGWKFADYSRP